MVDAMINPNLPVRSDGGPAFPMVNELGVIHHSGMTLRDWFAGQALIGYLSGRNSARTPEEWSDLAWQAADAMIASRSKVQPK